MSESIVSQIVAIAAQRTPGVHALASHARLGAWSRDELGISVGQVSGVVTTLDERHAVIHVNVVAEDGVALPALADQIRRHIATAVAVMTDLRVVSVDVTVSDLHVVETKGQGVDESKGV